jgi:peptidylprolyl isomerase
MTASRVPQFVLAASAVLVVVACDSPPDPPQANTSKPAMALPPKPPSATRPAKPLAEKKDIPAPPDVAEAPADAQKTASGLKSNVLTKGTGEDKPRITDKVKVKYTGWTTDGKMFDTSEGRPAPAEFGVGGVIKGWQEGLQLMVVGEKRRMWIPADLAYGDRPQMPGMPSGALTFDVELLAIDKGPEPPETPKDLAAPPADAKKTKSGLAYKLLSKGEGTKSPTEKSRVRVHYSGWTKDGNMFDSSVIKGQPLTFPLDGVIKGWTEGLQLMKEGDKMRLWIPADLAYGAKATRPGAPSGDLVFDVELIQVL